MSRLRHALCTLLVLAPFAFSVASCPGEPAGEELNVFSARHYDADQLLYAAFTEETGIAINLVEGDGKELLARLKQAGDSADADVFVTVDAGNLWTADSAGIFQPVESEILSERIPAHLRHDQGHWFGFSVRARCLFYSKERVDPTSLSTYEALADPAWNGRVLIRSSSNVYNQSLVGSLIANHGEAEAEQWATALVANMARKPQGGDTDQIRAVSAGEGDLAVANSYYYARLLKSDAPEDREVVSKVGIFFPNQDDRGTHVNVSGAGVLKSSQNRDNAVRFLEFLASDEAQEIFARANNEFPVCAGVPVDAVLQPWLDHRFDSQTPVEAFARLNREAIQLMDRAGWR